MVWVVVVLAAAAVVAAPVVVAVLRDAERTGLVVLLTVLALPTGGVTWPAALYCAFRMPRRRVPARYAPAARPGSWPLR